MKYIKKLLYLLNKKEKRKVYFNNIYFYNFIIFRSIRYASVIPFIQHYFHQKNLNITFLNLLETINKNKDIMVSVSA